MDPEQQLRECANQCNAAADHIRDSKSRGAQAGAGKFNWTGLIQLMAQMIPALLSLFTSQNPQPQVLPPSPPQAAPQAQAQP